MVVLYISRLMKGHEVLKACAEFRDVDSRFRRLQMKIVKKKKAMAATTAS